MIPRSSSVVVKRVPPARPGKGKAAMYIGAPGTSATSESKPNSQPGSTSWGAKGSMSRRFDKEASSSRPATVRVHRALFVSLIPSLLTLVIHTQTSLPSLTTGNDDEAAAMAAMFQAQSANWEETQEKMSQLVSPLALLFVSCSNLSNTYLLSVPSRAVSPRPLFSSTSSVKLGFTPIHVERGSVAEAASRLHHITNRTDRKSVV